MFLGIKWAIAVYFFVGAIVIFGVERRSLVDFCRVAIVLLGVERGDRCLIFVDGRSCFGVLSRRSLFVFGDRRS